jgi:hypothetical protein
MIISPTPLLVDFCPHRLPGYDPDILICAPQKYKLDATTSSWILLHMFNLHVVGLHSRNMMSFSFCFV